MARLGSPPVMQFYDTSGNLLRAGKVYTYETGASTTEKATYSDFELTVKHRNPVVLDSLGSAVIYLKSDGDYRFVIKDSNDVTLHTIDDVSGINNPEKLYNNIDVNGNSIISSSNGDISITPDGTGSLSIDGLVWIYGDGTAGQLVGTNGSGTLDWLNNALILSQDATPQLGGNLDTNSSHFKIDNTKGIKDESGNEQIIFSTTNSAVNYATITNSATGNGPLVSVAGDDTNVDLNLNSKGIGSILIGDLSCPISDGSADQVLITDGAGSLSFSDIVSASQSNMESASNIELPVSSSNLNYHPGIAKAWVTATAAGSIDASHNVDSVTDSGSGIWSVDWTNAFSDTDYIVIASVELTTATTSSGMVATVSTANPATVSSVKIDTWRTSDNNRGDTNVINIHVIAYGDQ